MTWCVFRERLERVAPGELAEGLAEALGWGEGRLLRGLSPRAAVWFRGEEEAAARRLADALALRGIPARAVREEDLRRPPRPLLVRRAACTPEGFEVQAPAPAAVLPWEEVGLLAAAWVRETVQERRATRGPTLAAGALPAYPASLGGLGFPVRPRKSPTGLEVARQQSQWVLDLVTRDLETRLRIRSREFNYDTLGERRDVSANANFALLAGDLATAAPRAQRNARVATLAEGEAVIGRPGSLEEYEEEVFWHCQWLAWGEEPPGE